jgi:hypothetical protein
MEWFTCASRGWVYERITAGPPLAPVAGTDVAVDALAEGD